MSIHRTPTSGALLAERYRAALTRWPVPAEQRLVSTSDGETFVVSSGPAHAPPLVLLHGSAGNSLAWLDFAARFGTRFRLHAVDLPGEAGLSTPTRLSTASGGHVRWLAEVLAALGVHRAGFVATSLGGRIALDHAIHRPDQVERLALTAPSGLGRQSFGWLPKALWYGLRGEAGRRKLFRLVMGTRVAPEQEEYLLFVNRHFRPRQGRVGVATDEQLRGLDLPLLVGLGTRDVLLDSRETQRRLTEHVPSAQVHLLPDTGHHVPLDRLPVSHFLEASRA